MADRNIAKGDTIGQFRTTFNNLSSDVGDIATLSGYSATDVVGALNEEKTATHYSQDDILAISVALAD